MFANALPVGMPPAVDEMIIRYIPSSLFRTGRSASGLLIHFSKYVVRFS